MSFGLKAKKLLAILLAAILVFAALPSAVVGALGSSKQTAYITLPEYNSTSGDTAKSVSVTRALAETLNNGFKSFEEVVDITDFNIHYTQQDVDLLVTVMSGYLPESFHIDSGFGITYNEATEQITGIKPTYLYTKAEYDSMLAACTAKANEIVGDLKNNQNLTDVEKALLIHDRIALLCSYDYENYLSNTVSRISHTMYGVLGNRVAVCQGYALTYGWLLDMVGIENEYVSSDTLNHAWNIVYINGIPYHVDVTNDDPVWDITGRVKHTNFLRSTEGIKATGHNATDFNSTPTDTTYDNHFWQDSNTAFTLLGDEIYYICNVHDYIMRYSDNTAIYDITSKWWANEAHTSIWADQARLDTDGNVLLFSLSDGIYSFNPATNKVRLVWKATLTSYFSVFGFTLDDGYLIYDMSLTPNFDENTKKQYEVKVKYTPSQQTPTSPSAGDVNGDLGVNIDDVVLMAQSVAGWNVECNGASTDVNGDGSTTIDDVVYLAQYIAGWQGITLH